MKKVPQRCSVFSIILSALIALFMISCEYEFIQVEDVDPNTPVSFSSDIVPIFTTGNNCTGCHKPGATSPDFTAGSAYNSIVPNLINSENPEESKIYKYPNPSTSTHNFRKYTQTQASLILNWIKQGALNN